jgi:hypothetical protein
MTATLFRLGQLLATPGALKALDDAHVSVETIFARHSTGDWGELCEQDKRENEFSINRRLRILSAYRLPTGDRIYCITEADRSATTILLPEEY